MTDTLPAGDAPVPVDVLVIEARPVACQRAIGAVSQGTARAVICNDEPDRLPASGGNFRVVDPGHLGERAGFFLLERLEISGDVPSFLPGEPQIRHNRHLLDL